jgi:hypothetical protein
MDGDRPPYISISERLIATVRALGLTNLLLIAIAVLIAALAFYCKAATS